MQKWISAQGTLPEPGERVLATDGVFVGEAYRTSANSWYRAHRLPMAGRCDGENRLALDAAAGATV